VINKDPVLVVELNEFNLELLRRAADAFGLRHLQRILEFPCGTTLADQEHEHQGLDPWVQWVSVHTESTSQEHGIIRLGDVPRLKKRQIWERLGDAGWTTGVWGVMNASRNNASNNLFFVADPWTFSQAPFPEQLGLFLSLPGYFAKNYLDLSRWRIIGAALRTGWYLLRHLPLRQMLSDAGFLLRSLTGVRAGTVFLFCAFELLSVRVFARFRAAHRPDANFIFINCIAHFQHHDWNAGAGLDKTAEFVFSAVDRMLSILLPPEGAPGRILVLNGLSQRNVSGEHLYCYRQINPARFLKRLDLQFQRIEQCMTSDAHVFFATAADRQRAVELLSSATVNGKRAFDVEPDPQDGLKLFYQVAYWDEAAAGSLLVFAGREIPFLDEFGIHAKRTGAHVPEGTYLAHGIDMPDRLANADVLRHIWPVDAAPAH